METTVIRQFVMLSLHPEKGRRIIKDPFFRYSLAGAILMDFLNSGEITLKDKRVIPSFRRNGESIHDMFAELIESKSRPWRVLFWVNRLSLKSRFIFRETVNSIISAGILRHERRYFLNIIPYNRYFFNDPGYRNEIQTGLRNVLLQDISPSREQIILIGLLHASKALNILSFNREEKRIIKRSSLKLTRENVPVSEQDKAIREILAVVASSARAAAAVSHIH